MIEQGPLRGSESDLIQHGYAPHAYDKEGEERLWDLGLQLCSAAEK